MESTSPFPIYRLTIEFLKLAKIKFESHVVYSEDLFDSELLNQYIAFMENTEY